MKNNKFTKESGITCPINEALQCSTRQRNCDCCGWNPKVAQERLEKMGVSAIEYQELCKESLKYSIYAPQNRAKP